MSLISKSFMNNLNNAICINLESCIYCNMCVRTCEAQGPAVYAPGDRTQKIYPAVTARHPVTPFALPTPPNWPQPRDDKVALEASGCMECGQCAVVCPTGAITVNHDDLDATRRLLAVANGMSEPQAPRSVVKHVVWLIAPSTRLGIGESFGLAPGQSCSRSLVTQLRALGGAANTLVFDVDAGADATTIVDLEEFKEIRAHNKSHGRKMPMMTSCCPGWVKFARMHAGELLPGVSTARSCVAMMAAIVRHEWSKENGVNPNEVAIISVMPCAAKKGERRRTGLGTVAHGHDLDASLTVEEAAELLQEKGLVLTADTEPINYTSAASSPFDAYGGLSSGSAAIFGRTCGVAESVVRQYVAEQSTERVHNVDWKPVDLELPAGQRAAPGHHLREAEVVVNGETIRIAAACGGQAIQHALRELHRDLGRWDMLEVMACPWGCVGGAGMPSERGPAKQKARVEARIAGLNNIDRDCNYTAAIDCEITEAHVARGHRCKTDLPEEIRDDILHIKQNPL